MYGPHHFLEWLEEKEMAVLAQVVLQGSEPFLYGDGGTLWLQE